MVFLVFCQKQAKNLLLILIHHLKGLSRAKLSVNHVMDQRKLKLWLFKDALFNASFITVMLSLHSECY